MKRNARAAKRKRIDDAIDRLASLYDGGHLLASTQPDVLLNLAAEEIERRRVAGEREETPKAEQG